jgi:predicted O-methyltransferase YrrM
VTARRRFIRDSTVSIETSGTPSGAKQAAEMGTKSGYSGKKVWQGLKPASLLCCSYGTTEVVPCYKAAF